MQSKAISRIALVTAVLLCVPLVAMQITDEVEWRLGDFIVAGALLLGAGLAYERLSRKRRTPAHRTVVGVAVGAALLLVWITLAVGIPGV